jgi:hypothetical protein
VYALQISSLQTNSSNRSVSPGRDRFLATWQTIIQFSKSFKSLVENYTARSNKTTELRKTRQRIISHPYLPSNAETCTKYDYLNLKHELFRNRGLSMDSEHAQQQNTNHLASGLIN